MGTAAGVTNFCGLHANVHGEIRQVVHGVADELLARLAALGGLNAPHAIFGRPGAGLRHRRLQMRGRRLLLSGEASRCCSMRFACGVVGRRGHIDALVIETKSGRRAVRGNVFIDCSGDGDLAALPACRSRRATAPATCSIPTTMFRLTASTRRGRRRLATPALMKEADSAAQVSPQGRHHPADGASDRVARQLHPGQNANGRALNGADADELSAGEIEGRRQAVAFFDFLKREAPGFADAYIVDMPPQLGIRETRRIASLYQLTGDDVLSCASFPDSIGVNGWPIEAHVVGDMVGAGPSRARAASTTCPTACWCRRACGNLLVAGRCAGMSHEGQSAARVSGGCFVMGEAAGTAAHLALAGKGAVPDIDVGALQRLLERGGAWLGLADAALPIPVFEMSGS